MNIVKNDMVVVIAGKDKGKVGRVIEAQPEKNRIIVDGINIQTKHKKASAKMQQAGIVHMPGPIHVSNVMLYDEKAKSGTRVRLEARGGKKVRISVKTGNEMTKNLKKEGK